MSMEREEFEGVMSTFTARQFRAFAHGLAAFGSATYGVGVRMGSATGLSSMQPELVDRALSEASNLFPWLTVDRPVEDGVQIVIALTRRGEDEIDLHLNVASIDEGGAEPTVPTVVGALEMAKTQYLLDKARS